MTPREALETQIEAGLATITLANGYDLPRPIRSISRTQETLDQVSAGDLPGFRLWTQEEPSAFIELSRVVETSLLISVVIYESVVNDEIPANILNRYAAAVRRCLARTSFAIGLDADVIVTIGGVTQHDIFKDNLPRCKTTVAATIQYLHED